MSSYRIRIQTHNTWVSMKRIPSISFIPIFLEKEDALMCMNLMARDKHMPSEVQAVIYEELAGHAAVAGFSLYLLNKAGEVIEKINP